MLVVVIVFKMSFVNIEESYCINFRGVVRVSTYGLFVVFGA